MKGSGTASKYSCSYPTPDAMKVSLPTLYRSYIFTEVRFFFFLSVTLNLENAGLYDDNRQYELQELSVGSYGVFRFDLGFDKFL
jgi:hypothetical protein